MYHPAKKHSLLIPTGDENHLFIVMNDACLHKQHLLLSISSIKQSKPAYDKTCVLSPGDHPFIIKPSFVYYKLAQIKPSSVIEKCVKGKTYIRKDDLNDVIFQRIYDGINISDFTPLFAINYIETVL